jgi:predicted aconitase
MGAAGAASGSLSLFHIAKITPEAKYKLISLKDVEEKIEIGREELNEVKDSLNTGKEEEIDFVAFGCPHASIQEIKEIAMLLKGRKVKSNITFWICTSRITKEIAKKLGILNIIEDAGAKVVADTCMVVAPIENLGFTTTATNSAKAAKYLPRFSKQKVVFGSTKEIIEKVTVQK